MSHMSHFSKANASIMEGLYCGGREGSLGNAIHCAGGVMMTSRILRHSSRPLRERRRRQHAAQCIGGRNLPGYEGVLP
jgi:hypothetical protein